MSSASIQINSQGQFGALEKYVALLQQIIGLQALMRQGGSSGLGGGAGAATGRPPPPPSAPGGGVPPGGAGGGGGGAPPPPPSPGTPPGGGSGGAPPPPSAPGGGGSGGAPPPPPGGGGGGGGGSPSPGGGGVPIHWRQGHPFLQMPWGQWVSATPAGLNAANLGAIAGGLYGSRYGQWGSFIGSQLGATVAPMVSSVVTAPYRAAWALGTMPFRMAGEIGRGVFNFTGNALSTAAGVSLGTSLNPLSIAAQGIDTYMQLSTVLAQVGRRFRDTSDDARMFGSAMGYTRAQSAQFTMALGRIQNRFDASDGTRMLGFARYTGASGDSAIGSFGTVSELSGRAVNNAGMSRALAVAQAMGLDQGRIEEFLERLSSNASTSFGATGRASLENSLAVTMLPALLYGANDPRRANDTTVTGGLRSAMQSQSWRTQLLRAMNYGGAGGPGYIEAMTRLDAGLEDPRNLRALASDFASRAGGNRNQLFGLLYNSTRGTSLTASQIAALTDATLSGKLDTFGMTPDGEGIDFMNARGISAGETQAQKREDMLFGIGKELAPSVLNLQSAIIDFGKTVSNILGADFGGTLRDLTEAMKQLAAWSKEQTEGGPTVRGALVKATAEAMAGRSADPTPEYLRARVQYGAKLDGVLQPPIPLVDPSARGGANP